MDKQVERELREVFGIVERTPLEAMVWKDCGTQIAPGRMGYRTQTIKAGRMLEINCYPLLGRSQEAKAREALRNRTPQEVQRANARRAERRIARLVNANFDRGDYHITLTYAGDAPGYDRAKRDVANYIRRVNRARERAGLPACKYIYAVEDVAEGRQVRTHTHLILSGGLPRERMEKLWGKGYANTLALEPDERGLEGIAKYLIKAQSGRKRWIPSRNLKKPRERKSDMKLSGAKVKRIAADAENLAKEVLEKAYPGHVLVACRVRWSERVDGVYISAMMRDVRQKREGFSPTSDSQCLHWPSVPSAGPRAR